VLQEMTFQMAKKPLLCLILIFLVSCFAAGKTKPTEKKPLCFLPCEKWLIHKGPRVLESSLI